MWAFKMRSGGANRSWNRCWRSRIQNGPKDPLEFIFQVSNHGGVGKAKSSKRSDNKCSSGSKSTCRGRSSAATATTFCGGFASKLVFAFVKILARTATRGGSSH